MIKILFFQPMVAVAVNVCPVCELGEQYAFVHSLCTAHRCMRTCTRGASVILLHSVHACMHMFLVALECVHVLCPGLEYNLCIVQ